MRTKTPAIAELLSRVPQKAHAAGSLQATVFDGEAARANHLPPGEIRAIEQLAISGRGFHWRGS
jgi:hypothetical protein